MRKLAIIFVMRVMTILVAFPMMAFGASVESLPVSEYADTEASTNVSLSVDLASTSRMEFSLSLDASSTNCVEVAVGTDADGDGDLSLEESDWTFGYRCGAWFARDAVVDREVERVGGGGQRREHLFVLKKRELDVAWNLVKVTRRGVAEIGEVVLVEGRKPGAALFVR